MCAVGHNAWRIEGITAAGEMTPAAVVVHRAEASEPVPVDAGLEVLAMR